jgi:hypothetical protein
MYTHTFGLQEPPLPELVLELVLLELDVVELVLEEVELEVLVDPPPLPLHVTGAQSAGTALGVQSGWLVWDWTHW